MNNRVKINPLLFLFVSSLIVYLLINKCLPHLDAQKTSCFYVLTLNLAAYILIWTFILLKKEVDILEPIVLVSAIHIMLYYVAPLICLYIEDYDWFELDFWSGCRKSTYLATIGYICFIAGYYLKNQTKPHETTNKDTLFLVEAEKHNLATKEKIKQMSLLLWFVGYLSSVILVVSTGRRLNYVFFLGDSGVDEISLESHFLFLGLLSHLMVPSFIYIFALSENKLLKIILFYLMSVSYIIRGFRFILVAIILSPIIFFYTTKNKRPKLSIIILLIVILSFLTNIVGVSRIDVRAGRGIDSDIFTMVSVENASNIILNNFSIFKNFYAIVDAVPKKINYSYGREIFIYTCVMFVPRFLWPSKPDPPIYDYVAMSVSEYARKAGTAPPNLAEFFFEFGSFGIMLFMFLFGYACDMLFRVLKQDNIHSYVLYACVYPLLFQIVIRGYTPSNFYLILVVILPIVILQHFFKDLGMLKN